MFKRLVRGFKALWNDIKKEVRDAIIIASTIPLSLIIFIIGIHHPIFLIFIPIGFLIWLLVCAWKRGSE